MIISFPFSRRARKSILVCRVGFAQADLNARPLSHALFCAPHVGLFRRTPGYCTCSAFDLLTVLPSFSHSQALVRTVGNIHVNELESSVGTEKVRLVWQQWRIIIVTLGRSRPRAPAPVRHANLSV